MKRKIYWLTTEGDNTGTDTALFTTEAGQTAQLTEYMRTAIAETLQRASLADWETRTIQQVEAAIAAGEIMEAWELFSDGADGTGFKALKDSDFCVWWGDQELELPGLDLVKPIQTAARLLDSDAGAWEAGRVLREALADLATQPQAEERPRFRATFRATCEELDDRPLIVAEGRSRSACFLNIGSEIERQFGEVDELVFEAFAALADGDETSHVHTDFSQPEGNFTLTVEELE